MIRSAAKYIRTFFILACITATITAAAIDPGCDDLTREDLVFPVNTIVDVKLMTAEPNGAAGAMSDALAQLNGKIGGVTFNLNSNQYNDDHAQISVFIGGTNGDDVGSFTARVLYINGTPIRDGGNLSLYSDLATCGPSKTSKCLDPTMPGYYKAMQGAFLHEFFHALGSLHSNKDNIMYPGVRGGVNGLATSNWALDCLIPQLNKLINPTPPAGCN
jgi:hypothetical protein